MAKLTEDERLFRKIEDKAVSYTHLTLPTKRFLGLGGFTGAQVENLLSSV